METLAIVSMHTWLSNAPLALDPLKYVMFMVDEKISAVLMSWVPMRTKLYNITYIGNTYHAKLAIGTTCCNYCELDNLILCYTLSAVAFFSLHTFCDD